MKGLTKTKSLVFIIILLLLTNVALMVFFVLKEKPAKKQWTPEQGAMYQALKNEVGFSGEQLKQYQELRMQHKENLKPHFNRVNGAKENFYNLLYLPFPSDSLLNAAADSIGSQQKLLDLEMFSSFQKIRNTCTPEQLPKFDSVIKKTVQRMTGRQGKFKRDTSK